ncbi:hypothetical protein [Roseovarius ramblicola]|uniref:Uncharacterized protein n=1 Tax=Roseovarius ramblicola TaxID=2022336 RepID=A0ABV5I052_9RHOB
MTDRLHRITGEPGGFVTVDYSGIGTTIDVQIDGGANTGSVVKNGLGTDTFTNVENPLFAGWTTGGCRSWAPPVRIRSMWRSRVSNG